MQPVYQIPGDVLKAHVTRLSTALGGELAPGYLHALLFLSGVHAAFCYFKAAHAGSEFFINYSPSHHLDDGLVAVSRSAIKTLMQECRSRSLQSGLKLIPLSPPQNRDWLAVSIAFATIFSRTTKTVKEWLSKGDTEENKLRLSCGMGVESFFNQTSGSFVRNMVKSPLRLDERIVTAIRAFALTADNALPEL
jgi:hypothetical protein